MYLSPLERVPLLLIYFSIFAAPPFDPLAPAVIYLHSIFFWYFSIPQPLPCHTTTTISLPMSPAALHASRLRDIAFLILLTGDNVYVLFFDIHFSCWHRPQSGPDTQHTSSSPFPYAFMYSPHFPLCLHQNLLLLILLLLFFVLFFHGQQIRARKLGIQKPWNWKFEWNRKLF